MNRAGILALLLLVLTGFSTASAGIVVNEVLANEPGGNVTLEWFELYNDAATHVFLQFYQIQAGGGLFIVADTVGPYSYLVVCDKLFSDTVSPGFESVWGNGSGVWGDTTIESYRRPIEIGISLTNGSGSVAMLLGGVGPPESFLSWDAAGGDGVSWERVTPGGDDVGQSLDPSGGTPGFVNSLTPLDNDLMLTVRPPASAQGVTTLNFRVVNFGLQDMPAGSVTVFYDDETDPGTYGQVLTTIPYDASSPGDTMRLSDQVTLDGVYFPLVAEVPDDDRLRNNRRSFVAPGTSYPPMVITEFLPNPTTALDAEWVEVRNIHDEAMVLSGWRIGDAYTLAPVSLSPVTVQPGDYLVLTDDRPLFLAYYGDFVGACLEVGGWPALNNDGDMVRLADGHGYVVDSVEYAVGYEEDYTVCRTERFDGTDQWGRSEIAGGTPGGVNSVVLRTAGTQVRIRPDVFSPNGDGIDETATIIISVPEASSYTMEIYDRQGRSVKEFFSEERFPASEYEWDGSDDDGERLPIGIYILYLEVSGIESVKTPIVIAR